MLTKIKIESGIEIPEAAVGGGRCPLFVAMTKMKVGDSFAVPKGELPTVAGKYAAQAKIKIITRTVLIGDKKFTRVWRTK